MNVLYLILLALGAVVIAGTVLGWRPMASDPQARPATIISGCYLAGAGVLGLSGALAPDEVVAVLLMAAGAMVVLGGLLNWSWMLDHRKARPVVNALGRTGARAFYGALGVVLAGLGVAAWLGTL